MSDLDALYTQSKQELLERLNALFSCGQNKLKQTTKTRKIIPCEVVDSQLHFIVTAQQKKWVTTKQANEAIKKLLQERKGKYGNRYQF